MAITVSQGLGKGEHSESPVQAMSVNWKTLTGVNTPALSPGALLSWPPVHTL